MHIEVGVSVVITFLLDAGAEQRALSELGGRRRRQCLFVRLSAAFSAARRVTTDSDGERG